MGRLLKLWTEIRSSLWFIPTVIVGCAIALAVGMIEVDRTMGIELRTEWPRLLDAEADGTRAMLAAIAGTMMTVTGVVFSITILALAQASTQYSPRILQTFMRDVANQIVLGVFVGIFVYCVIVLRSVSSGFVPGVAVATGVALTMVGIGFLIFFIHHIAQSIQASEIIASISRETLAAVDRLFPDELGEESSARDEFDRPPVDIRWYAVPALTTGYIQSMVMNALLDFAEKHDIVVRMECAIGEFITVGRPIVSLSRQIDGEHVCDSINGIFAIDTYRTVDQDAAFGIRQLVDIALKALSPGINDTSTATICVDYLSAILERTAHRRIESPYRSRDGELRVIAVGPTFRSLLAQAYSQILENGAGNAAVIRRILVGLRYVAIATGNPDRLLAISDQVDIIEDVTGRSITTKAARESIEEHLRSVRDTLKEAGRLRRTTELQTKD